MIDFDALELGYDIPARVGMAEADIQTPALIIDLVAFEHNIVTLQNQVNAMGVRLRAHAKTHKSADIGMIQIAQGAVGLCCQKVSEAEALIRSGIRDILISNEVRDPVKLDRLAQLAARAKITICVDDAQGIADLSEAVVRHGTAIDVLVELDVGSGRCGVQPGGDAVDLAFLIQRAPGLRFAGLQAYNGSAQHIYDHANRARVVGEVVEATRVTIDLLANAGMHCEVVAGAGTGTYPFEGGSGVFNELQCGSYCFMDADYDMVSGEGNMRLGGFHNALFVLSSVMSDAGSGQVVCDAGLKVTSMESGLPRVFGVDGVTYREASDEHGVLDDPRGVLSVNDRVRLVPGHCDPTCNLHDWYVGVRHGIVEVLWPVTARGKAW